MPSNALVSSLRAHLFGNRPASLQATDNSDKRNVSAYGDFGKLPREVRDIIWGYSLYTHRGLVCRDEYSQTHLRFHARGVRIALLQTSSHIFTEASLCAIEVNSLRVNDLRWYDPITREITTQLGACIELFDDCQLRRFRKDNEGSLWQRIRKLEIHTGPRLFGRRTFGNSQLDLICTALHSKVDGCHPDLHTTIYWNFHDKKSTDDRMYMVRWDYMDVEIDEAALWLDEAMERGWLGPKLKVIRKGWDHALTDLPGLQELADCLQQVQMNECGMSREECEARNN